MALSRAVTLCDGWITHGSGPEEHAWEQLALIKGALAEAGRSPDGFDIYLAVNAKPDADLYKRFADAGRDRHALRAVDVRAASARHPDRRIARSPGRGVPRFSDEVIAKVG